MIRKKLTTNFSFTYIIYHKDSWEEKIYSFSFQIINKNIITLFYITVVFNKCKFNLNKFIKVTLRGLSCLKKSII